jgi:glycosyltransferase involved in cell wall biosynthesis
MLSILLTIYKYNLYPLVVELHKQCVKSGIEFEILCQDDASKSDCNIENEKINLLSNCNFRVLEKNVGYRENKNILASRAKYDYFLIMDGDCTIINSNFIQNYIDAIEGFEAVYGGRLHPEKCPSNHQKLRWKYGKFMEDKLCENRNKSPYQSFLFNNTVISKELFNKIKFDGSVNKYRHDDTLFSYKMMCLQSKISHIENPVVHNDIDPNLVYIKKTKESLENLYDLYLDKKVDTNYIKMLRVFHFLKTSNLTFIVTNLYKYLEKPIFKNLEGENPKLWVFNFFRIGYLCSLSKLNIYNE